MKKISEHNLKAARQAAEKVSGNSNLHDRWALGSICTDQDLWDQSKAKAKQGAVSKFFAQVYSEFSPEDFKAFWMTRKKSVGESMKLYNLYPAGLPAGYTWTQYREEIRGAKSAPKTLSQIAQALVNRMIDGEKDTEEEIDAATSILATYLEAVTAPEPAEPELSQVAVS